MIYPERLKENDIIGITAPSNGLLKDAKIIALEKAIANLNKYGFRVCESDNVRKVLMVQVVMPNIEQRALWNILQIKMSNVLLLQQVEIF